MKSLQPSQFFLTIAQLRTSRATHAWYLRHTQTSTSTICPTFGVVMRCGSCMAVNIIISTVLHPSIYNIHAHICCAQLLNLRFTTQPHSGTLRLASPVSKRCQLQYNAMPIAATCSFRSPHAVRQSALMKFKFLISSFFSLCLILRCVLMLSSAIPLRDNCICIFSIVL